MKKQQEVGDFQIDELKRHSGQFDVGCHSSVVNHNSQPSEDLNVLKIESHEDNYHISEEFCLTYSVNTLNPYEVKKSFNGDSVIEYVEDQQFLSQGVNEKIHQDQMSNNPLSESSETSLFTDFDSLAELLPPMEQSFNFNSLSEFESQTVLSQPPVSDEREFINISQSWTNYNNSL